MHVISSDAHQLCMLLGTIVRREYKLPIKIETKLYFNKSSTSINVIIVF